MQTVKIDKALFAASELCDEFIIADGAWVGILNGWGLAGDGDGSAAHKHGCFFDVPSFVVAVLWAKAYTRIPSHVSNVLVQAIFRKRNRALVCEVHSMFEAVAMVGGE